MPPSVDRFDHVHVHVSDRVAAERWYGEVLGFKRVAKLESWATGGGPLMIEDAGGRVWLALFEKPAAGRHATIAMTVGAGEFVAWRGHLAGALGRPIEAVDHGLSWSMYFDDPDGNPFEITTYEYGEAGAGLRDSNG